MYYPKLGRKILKDKAEKGFKSLEEYSKAIGFSRPSLVNWINGRSSICHKNQLKLMSLIPEIEPEDFFPENSLEKHKS